MRTKNERIESVVRELEEQRLQLEGVTAKIMNLQLELSELATMPERTFSEAYRDAIDTTLKLDNDEARRIIKKHFRELYVEIDEEKP
jgi:hypothetical protein